MAFTGTAVYPSTSLFPGTGEYPGQGEKQLLLVLYSTDDASVLLPTWQDATADVRAFSTSRGRATELATVDAGTATITLNNRLRAYDPAHTTTIRPMNRWWIREQFSGVTESIFKGYAESYDQVWPEQSVTDAMAVVSCVDEFKVLARDKLPVMNPPRDTYKDVILFDNPQGYWRGDLVLNRISHAPTVGSVEMGVYVGAWARVASPIVGDYSDLPQTAASPTLLASSLTGYSATSDPSTLLPGLAANDPGDAAGLSAFTFETWFKSSEATPAAARTIALGPDAGGGAFQWGLELTTTGAIGGFARNSGGTLFNTVSVAALIAADTWCHLALVVTGAFTQVWFNGVQAAATGYSGSFAAMAAGSYMQLGTSTAVGGTRYYDEWAWYRSALSADRILAHYRAGAQRGFPAQDPGARIHAVLDTIRSTSPRSIRPGTREMTPTFMRGQSPLEELRRAENAEAVDAVLFVARDGTITFLDDGHRAVSPWDTVQTSFSKDLLPFVTVDLDYSDSFITNEWNVTRTGSTLQTASDATSISAYGPRPQSLTDLPLTTDADVTSIAAAMLAKYKDPMTRIVSLTINARRYDVIEALFGLEIGDKVRVRVTPPGGGSDITQTSFIQRIAVDADPYKPWRVTLGVTPL